MAGLKISPDVALAVPTAQHVADTLGEQGYTDDQINEVVQSMYVATQKQAGEPVGTVVLGEDGFVYVRVTDAVGYNRWRVVDPKNGDTNVFDTRPTISGKMLHKTADDTSER